MSVMVLDAGNSILKAKIARRENGEIAFPHAMKQLTESGYEKITTRAGMQNQSLDYLRINDQPYVIGESVERYGSVLNGQEHQGIREMTTEFWLPPH